MNTPEHIREVVLARLITRHGMTGQEATEAWEQYLLLLLGKRLGQESPRAQVESN